MINNIIFLDIDGVLNSDKYFSSIEDKEDTYTDPVAKLLLDIDMTKVKLLLKVVRISHAKIVISSTWRRMKLHCIVSHHGKLEYGSPKVPSIKEALINIGLPIVGETPFLEGQRGEEIRAYLADNQVDNFCIIDDEVFKDYQELEDNLIKTNFYEDGLTKEHANEVVKRLSK